MNDWAERLGGGLDLSVGLIGFLGVIFHIAFTLMDKSYIPLLIGFFVPPIGVVNGFGQLLGIW